MSDTLADLLNAKYRLNDQDNKLDIRIESLLNNADFIRCIHDKMHLDFDESKVIILLYLIKKYKPTTPLSDYVNPHDPVIESVLVQLVNDGYVVNSDFPTINADTYRSINDIHNVWKNVRFK